MQFSDIQVRKGLVAPNNSLVDQNGSQDGVAFADGVHGEYAAAALTGRLFYASNQAAVATTAALATTWTGLGIANPSASGKNLILREFSWGLSVVGSDEGALGLMSTTNSDFAAAIAAECCKYGAGGSVAYIDDGATIEAPILVKTFSTYGTGAITTWQGAGFQCAKLAGQIIIPPGRAICTYTTTATTAAFIFSFLWEELPL
jgi:hypothetical protein